jgi:hypothetical protein
MHTPVLLVSLLQGLAPFTLQLSMSAEWQKFSRQGKAAELAAQSNKHGAQMVSHKLSIQR